jgi:hypothetical protein
LTARRTHKTPSRSRGSLSEVSTISGQGHRIARRKNRYKFRGNDPSCLRGHRLQMNVIESKRLPRDASGKPGSAFPHPALAPFTQRNCPAFPSGRRNNLCSALPTRQAA